MGWVIEVMGRPTDLNFLTKELGENDLKIIKMGDKYFLESDQINEGSSPEHVRKFRDKYSERLNAILAWFVSDSEKIRIEFLFQKENGEKTNYGWIEVTIPMATCSANSYGIGGENPYIPISSVLTLADNNPAIGRVLQLIDQFAFSWYCLWKIFEIIRTDVGGEPELKRKNYVKPSDLIRFKRTCNSPNILGNEARHEIQNQIPPQNPMTLGEARDFILRMMNGWIEEKT